MRVLDAASLPPPAEVDALKPNRAYLIGPGDNLSIQVFGAEELGGTLSVDSTGRIALPLIGAVQASGTTPEDLEAIVRDRLRANYVRDPRVAVNLVAGRSQVVTVDGEVEEPGLYPVVGQMTLMRAIATAKGTTEFAKTRHVVIFRTVGEQRMAALYDLQSIRRGVYADPEVFANDVVLVGEDSARRTFQSLVSAGALLTGPIIALIQR